MRSPWSPTGAKSPEISKLLDAMLGGSLQVRVLRWAPPTGSRDNDTVVGDFGCVPEPFRHLAGEEERFLKSEGSSRDDVLTNFARFDVKPRHIPPKLPPVLDAAWRLARDRRAYLRIAYLLLAFPLGTLYFVVIITGLATGAGLAIVIVGFPILVVTLLAWLLFGRIERELAIHLLGAQIRPMSIPDPVRRSAWQRLLKVLGDPVTWKSMAYLLLEFPFGVFSFTVAIILVTVSLSLILY